MKQALRKALKRKENDDAYTDYVARPTHPAGFPGITLLYDHQRAAWDRIKAYKLIGTRFFDHELLQSLGLETDVQLFYGNMGLTGLFHMSEYTYRELVLEFFSTFQFLENTAPQAVNFMLCGRSHAMLLADFSFMMGCGAHDGLSLNAPSYFNPTVLWLFMSGARLRSNYKGATATQIHHPGLRLAHRQLGQAFFNKSETHPVTKYDLELMGSALNCEGNEPFSLDTGYIFAKLFDHISSGATRASTISCGGLITHIAKFRMNDFSEAGRDPIDPEIYIDFNLLHNKHHWLDLRNNRYLWRVDANHRNDLPLPCPNLPRLVHRGRSPGPPTSYLLPIDGAVPVPQPDRPAGGDFRAGLFESGPPVYSQPSQGGASSSSQPQQPPPTPSVAPTHSYPLRSGYPAPVPGSDVPPWFYAQQLYELNQTHYQAQEQAAYPHYHHAWATPGYIPPGHTHPPWFDGTSGNFCPAEGISRLSFNTGFPTDAWPQPFRPYRPNLSTSTPGHIDVDDDEEEDDEEDEDDEDYETDDE